jgi:hypothetical protein
MNRSMQKLVNDLSTQVQTLKNLAYGLANELDQLRELMGLSKYFEDDDTEDEDDNDLDLELEDEEEDDDDCDNGVYVIGCTFQGPTTSVVYFRRHSDESKKGWKSCWTFNIEQAKTFVTEKSAFSQLENAERHRQNMPKGYSSGSVYHVLDAGEDTEEITLVVPQTSKSVYRLKARTNCKPGTKGLSRTVYFREHCTKSIGYNKFWTTDLKQAKKFPTGASARSLASEITKGDGSEGVHNIRVVEDRS